MTTLDGNESVVRNLASAYRDGDPLPVTVLHIGAEQTSVAIFSGGAGPVESIDLRIGAARLSSEHFRRYPPTPLALENAIMVVEDELARTRTLIVEESILVTNDASVREIARVAGLDDLPVMVLRLEVVEQTFERLVAASLGRPEPGLPARMSFAAALLILREFMHHLGFSSISIVG